MRSAVVLVALLLVGCQGTPSKNSPIHLNPNMDQQDRLDPQEPSPLLAGKPLWADGRSERSRLDGTIPFGFLHGDEFADRGLVDGAFATQTPMALDQKLLDRGQGRFNIYCAPCHDAAGTGKGIVATKGLVPPPNFHQDRLRAFPVGQIFSVISQGARTMPAYAAQIPTEDRWAIAAYVKALQLSQSAPASAGQNGTK